MTNERRFSEKDLCIAERKAFVAGADWCYHDEVAANTPAQARVRWMEVAQSLFHMPSVVVVDSAGTSWRLNAGGIEYRYVQTSPSESDWYALPSSLPNQRTDSPRLTVERLDLLTKLRSEAE